MSSLWRGEARRSGEKELRWFAPSIEWRFVLANFEDETGSSSSRSRSRSEETSEGEGEGARAYDMGGRVEEGGARWAGGDGQIC